MALKMMFTMQKKDISHIFKASTILLVFLATTSLANAVTLRNVEVICPLDKELFTAKSYASFTRSGWRLDGRPVILGSPSLPPLPVCPESGFVVYRDDFTKEEIKRIQYIVTTNEFKVIRSQKGNRFIVAYIAEQLKATSYDLGYYYLEASWEAEDDGSLGKRRSVEFDEGAVLGLLPHDLIGKSDVLQRQYIKLSLEKFTEFLGHNHIKTPQWWAAQILSANIERKLERFDAAILRINALPRESLSDDSLLAMTFDQLVELIELQDHKPRTLRKRNK